MGTQAMIEELESIQIAASFDANNTYPSLFQLLGYRKAIAEQILRSTGTEEDSLVQLFNKVNYDIQRILGIIHK